MTLSVIIPTIGRDSLAAALASCADADEIVVVVDEAAGESSLPTLPRNAVKAYVNGGDHGYTARTRGIELATSTHLCFLDDDDVYTPDAIRFFREAACDVPVIFRMDHYTHGILWRDPELRFGNVSTQMFVVPNDPARLGVWAPHMPSLKEPGGDYTFLAGCVEKMGAPIWREEIVAVLRPSRGRTVAVVTPWLNHPELAPDYLAAMDAGQPDALIVVDNASTPPINFSRIRLEQNVGFSGASNIGLRAAYADIVLFLNNDISMTRPDWLTQIKAAVEPGVLAGAQLRTDLHGAVDGIQLPYLDGWCLAGMREDLLALDGWDEDLAEPSYYGDNLLCLRARAAGMTLREARVGLHHKNGQTSQPRLNPHVGQVTALNRALFEAKAREILGLADSQAA